MVTGQNPDSPEPTRAISVNLTSSHPQLWTQGASLQNPRQVPSVAVHGVSRQVSWENYGPMLSLSPKSMDYSLGHIHPKTPSSDALRAEPPLTGGTKVLPQSHEVVTGTPDYP